VYVNSHTNSWYQCFNRPLGGVIDAKKGTLPGISTMYHYQYEFTEADVFVGIRVFNHEGIGCDKFYTAKECDSMLLEHEGLNESTVGELRMATSTLQEGDLARQRAEGQGARLLRGEEHKDFDTDVRLQKEVKKNDVRTQRGTRQQRRQPSEQFLSHECCCDNIVRSPLYVSSVSVHTRTVVLRNRPSARARKRQLPYATPASCAPRTSPSRK
jgi:hypothetical protein